jgi:hypothetical protein
MDTVVKDEEMDDDDGAVVKDEEMDGGCFKRQFDKRVPRTAISISIYVEQQLNLCAKRYSGGRGEELVYI